MAIKSKHVPDVDRLEKGLRSGDRTMLAQAITLAESTLDSDRKKSEQLIEKLLPLTGKSIRIGITGVPGVGKSTFIETFGELLAHEGRKIGVLTIDPSSEKSRGSILGDKTRMDRLSKNPNVFIRPSPTNLTLGGVSHRTRECMLLCEAAGFDVILIETVGVGQSETHVRNMVDFFLLLMLSGAGDELQGIKKGIIEMADGLVITKADGENIKAAGQAVADAKTALHLLAVPASGWKPRVQSVSSVENKGIELVWKMILEFQKFTMTSGFFQEHRSEQKKKWLEESLENLFRDAIAQPEFAARKEKMIARIMNDSVAPSEAARKLWKSLGAE
jgi:LAO/AO transport system kinase